MPASAAASVRAASGRQSLVNHRFIERIDEKMLKKRLKKAIARSGDSDGKWLAVAGLASGLLGALSFLFFSYTGFFSRLHSVWQGLPSLFSA
ncbi:MAG: hypothetical protein IPJ82_08840 [Lewinellaceae bacterium]|nr:hypothetical protein [Lewinellaceae bacterium]